MHHRAPQIVLASDRQPTGQHILRRRGAIVRMFYLLPVTTLADHGSRGLPSGDVLRAKSSTVASIFFWVGPSAFASPATTGAAISVIKFQYSSADLKRSSPATFFSDTSFRPPLRKAVPIYPGAAQRNNPGEPGGGAGISTCLLIVPMIVAAQGFLSGPSQTAVQIRAPGFATKRITSLHRADGLSAARERWQGYKALHQYAPQGCAHRNVQTVPAMPGQTSGNSANGNFRSGVWATHSACNRHHRQVRVVSLPRWMAHTR